MEIPLIQSLTPYIPSSLKGIVDHLLARWSHPEKQILRKWQGQAPPMPKKKLCLFAHFDPQGKIHSYVLNYVRELHQLGCELVFISSSENLQESEVVKILPYCRKLIQRKNLTLDFGSWRIGLMETPEWNHYEQLILANDSVYGPLQPLGNLFQKMEEKNLDFWGITSTKEKEYHLQSYFLVFEKTVLRDPEFELFWKNFLYFRSKARIIDRYEIGMSRLAKKQQWRFGAFIESENTLNPTLYNWDRLIEEQSCPILKTEILKLNRLNSPRVAQWKQILASKTSYDIRLIEEHLKHALTES